MQLEWQLNWELEGVHFIISVVQSGRSETTLTSVWPFLTTSVDIFYLINVEIKSTFLDYLLPSSCKHSLWMAPYHFTVAKKLNWRGMEANWNYCKIIWKCWHNKGRHFRIELVDEKKTIRCRWNPSLSVCIILYT